MAMPKVINDDVFMMGMGFGQPGDSSVFLSEEFTDFTFGAGGTVQHTETFDDFNIIEGSLLYSEDFDTSIDADWDQTNVGSITVENSTPFGEDALRLDQNESGHIVLLDSADADIPLANVVVKMQAVKDAADDTLGWAISGRTIDDAGGTFGDGYWFESFDDTDETVTLIRRVSNVNTNLRQIQNVSDYTTTGSEIHTMYMRITGTGARVNITGVVLDSSDDVIFVMNYVDTNAARITAAGSFACGRLNTNANDNGSSADNVEVRNSV